MSGLNDEFVNDMCDYMYGEGWTPQDKRNLLRNIKPAYDGTGILKFGTIKNSEAAMEFNQDNWEYKGKFYELKRKERKDIKTEKDHIKVCKLLQEVKEECNNKLLEMREQCDEIERGALENSSIHQKLRYDYKKSINIIKEQQIKLEDIDTLKQKLSDTYINNADVELKFKEFYQEKYKKDRKKDEKEKEQWKRECEKQQDKICHMEMRERIKKLEKQNKNLQQQLIQSMN